MNASDSAVINTIGLSKTYQGVTALQSLDLHVVRHSIFGFLGPNGAGKSTTIKLLLGLAKPTSGSATIFGQDSVRDSVAIREKVGYLAQEPRYYDHLTARETLRFTARFFYKGPTRALEKRIAETLDLVGLADKADRPIKGFSGGIAMGVLFAEFLPPNLVPQTAMLALPWMLKNSAVGLVLGSEMPPVWSIPVVATPIWVAVLVGVALWRFDREEF
jgi:ABC-2 type transport system ATP-binding protein